MVEEVIKELTVTNNDDHITSGSVLAWAKRVEAQRVHAAVLDTLTESRQFYKVKISRRPKEDNTKGLGWLDVVATAMPVLWQITPTEVMSSIWEDMCRLWQDWTLQECMPQQKREREW